MYGHVVTLIVGTALLLGSLWGLLGLMPLLGMRALGEEEVLFEDLPGYREYAQEVWYRLVPGIW